MIREFENSVILWLFVIFYGVSYFNFELLFWVVYLFICKIFEDNGEICVIFLGD